MARNTKFYIELGRQQFAAGVERTTLTRKGMRGASWQRLAMDYGYKDERREWQFQCGLDTLSRGPYSRLPVQSKE